MCTRANPIMIIRLMYNLKIFGTNTIRNIRVVFVLKMGVFFYVKQCKNVIKSVHCIYITKTKLYSMKIITNPKNAQNENGVVFHSVECEVNLCLSKR